MFALLQAQLQPRSWSALQEQIQARRQARKVSQDQADQGDRL